MPRGAIFAEDDVPRAQREFIALNADLSKAWPPIVEKKDALPDAEQRAGVKSKSGELGRGTAA